MDVPAMLQKVLDIHEEVGEKLVEATARTAFVEGQLAECSVKNHALQGQVAALTVALEQEKDKSFYVHQELAKEIKNKAVMEKKLASLTTQLDKERNKASRLKARPPNVCWRHPL